MSMVVGPWGGDGGTSWDDGSYGGVREITLVYDRCIDWIRVVYDKNGKPVSGQKHGGVGGSTTAQVEAESVQTHSCFLPPFFVVPFNFPKIALHITCTHKQ